MSDGNEPDELRGCKGFGVALLIGGALWLVVIGLIVWLA